MKRYTTLFCYLCSMLAAIFSSACERNEGVYVNLAARDPVVVKPKGSTLPPLRLGMGAMITPKDGYVYYQQLQKYIEKKMGRPVLLVDRENYDEMNNLLESGAIDAAFVCAGPYVEGKKKFGMELIAMPVVNKKPVYYSYIIVHKDSSLKSLKDLKGKSFAFTDPKSNSGKLVPDYMLAKMDETPERFFSKIDYTYGHDKSIRAVAEKMVDGAAVDSLIWEYAAIKKPEVASQTKIIVTSDPYGIPPLVVRPDIAPELKQQLAEIVLNAANDPEGKEILTGMMVERFVAGDDKNYDSIRAMNKWVSEHRNKRK